MQSLRYVFLIFISVISAARGDDFSAEQLDFFETKVRPVLSQNCYQCHGPQKQNNGLRLDSRASFLKGSDYGKIAEPGQMEGAKFLKAIRHEADVEAMPREGKKLPDNVVADLTEWVRMGLPWPVDAAAPTPEAWRAHWAFQPVVGPVVPDPSSLPTDFPAWQEQAMDRLILQKMTESGLTPSPSADRPSLLKRVYIALVGFPPSFDQVQAFVNDLAPDAWAKVVDGLLGSPHFGERWARHWMDTARYADTKGYVFQEERRYAYAYTYRDWLIQSLNNDMPYDQFLIKQIAADRITDPVKAPADLAAMGFLTLGRRFLNSTPDIIDDRLDVIFRGTQALTVVCARCHDHKFDPIPTADYYALYGVLNNSHEPDEKPLLVQPERTPELESHEKKLAELQTKVDTFLQEKTDELFKPETVEKYKSALAELTNKTEDKLREFAKARGLNARALQRWSEWQEGEGKQPGADILSSPHGLKGLSREEITKGLHRGDRERLSAFKSEIEKFKATSLGAPARAMVMVDNATISEPVVFIRGNAGRLGPQISRRFLSCLSSGDPAPLTDGSGRLQLAQRIASRENPLTARVMVNRVWAKLWGTALVDPPGDFGVRTARPRQAALLDYMASQFMAEGWSLKKAIRSVVMSHAWRQTSAPRPDAEAEDPENQLLARQNRLRLDFESLRDSLLWVTGGIDPVVFGKSVDLFSEPFTGRRSLYGFIDRQNLPSVFRTFDFASPDSTASRRFETTVPQQALYMLNSSFVVAQARRLVQGMHASEEKDSARWVRTLFRRILHREPEAAELDLHLTAVRDLHREPRQTGTRWQNGYGFHDELESTVNFTPLPFFHDKRWSGSSDLPDEKLGWVMLSEGGSHPGDATHSAIRRWNSPENIMVKIVGTVVLPTKESGGIKAKIVHGRQGVLWQAIVLGGDSAEANVASVELQIGDTLDFIVESGQDVNCDTFMWEPVIRDAMSQNLVTHAAKDFGGPGVTAWEAWTQVLLCSNEFLFVD